MHALSPPWGDPTGQARERATRVVCIGGGTGLPIVLRGLLAHRERVALGRALSLTAIAAMSDDGGSSGRLRRECAMPPPGDLRNCLVALSPAQSELARLFQHRFGGEMGPALGGHALGNLALAALFERGSDLLECLAIAGRLLQIEGQVLPSTLSPLSLLATFEDGRIIRGEGRFAATGGTIRTLCLEPAFAPPAPGVLSAIEDADLVVLGPGSLFSSILSTLLLPGVATALRTCRAPKVLVANLLPELGETASLDGSAHLKALERHVGRLIDLVLVNTAEPQGRAREWCARSGLHPLHYDRRALGALGVEVAGEALLASSMASLRHSSWRVGSALWRLIGPATRDGAA